MNDWMTGPLCPFGLAGDEPLGSVEGKAMGVREAVWRGVVDREVGEKVYPHGDWSVIPSGDA